MALLWHTQHMLHSIQGVFICSVSFVTNPDAYLKDSQSSGSADTGEEKLAPGAISRVHLLRLLEELVVDGVNEIVLDEAKMTHESEGQTDTIEPHSGGTGRNKNERPSGAQNESAHNPKHQEA
jgi:hypothetical protein